MHKLLVLTLLAFSDIPILYSRNFAEMMLTGLLGVTVNVVKNGRDPITGMYSCEWPDSDSAPFCCESVVVEFSADVFKEAPSMFGYFDVKLKYMLKYRFDDHASLSTSDGRSPV